MLAVTAIVAGEVDSVCNGIRSKESRANNIESVAFRREAFLIECAMCNNIDVFLVLSRPSVEDIGSFRTAEFFRWA